MKKTFITLLLIIPIAGFSQTQTEMNMQAAKDYNKADKNLNFVYQQVIKKYAKDTLFIKYLKQEELTWINYRDAAFKRQFPKFMNGQLEYGTMFSLERSTFMQGFTEERTKILKQILKDGPN